jgi:PAS domain S-box-containing protein
MQPPRAPGSSPASYSPPDQDYLSLLESSQEGIAAFDEEWRFVYLNATAERLLGRSRHELIGAVLWDLVTQAAPYQEALFRVRELGEPMIWEECAAFPELHLRVRAERLDSLVVLRAQDDTARHAADLALRDSEVRYRQVFESNPIPMFLWDLETLRIVHVNRAALERYGYTQEELRGMTMFDLRPEEDVPRLRTWRSSHTRSRSTVVPSASRARATSRRRIESWRRSGDRRHSASRRRRWKPSAGLRAGSLTTSMTSSPSSAPTVSS